MKLVEGVLEGRSLKVSLVAARLNETISERLVEGARRALRQHGVQEEDIELVWVPGSFEIPLAVAELIERIALGAGGVASRLDSLLTASASDPGSL